MSETPDFNEALTKVMTGLFEGLAAERRKDPEYQKLFQESTGYEGFLDVITHKMSGVALDACQVLEEKYGVERIGSELYMFLLSLPLLEYITEKQIEKTEGHVYCVDKTYFLLKHLLVTKITENEEETVRLKAEGKIK